MEIKVTQHGEPKTTSRKMRTTRGPGFTTIEQSYLIEVWDTKVRDGFEDALNDSTAWPQELRDIDADKVSFSTGYWFDTDRSKNSATLRLHFEDLGHAKRAEAAMKRLKAIKIRGVDVTFVQSVVTAALEQETKRIADREAAQNIAWVASGIVSEAGRRARDDTAFEARAQALRAELADVTEKHATSMVSAISREHGFDEAELREAVSVVLSKPSFYLARISA